MLKMRKVCDLPYIHIESFLQVSEAVQLWVLMHLGYGWGMRRLPVTIQILL